ncbi:class A beta-lactamase-related serine hydrolase [Labedella phragmitis]|uniref:Class A beta-lactamase-related serine hydrolase n=1 Tax=Labedella phragmitis TaxID=2498849 RepID=A0A444PUJ9_9MICO|nr:serine hydrolase domain-containing protein [Labedella phragmitis]RWZ51555.1 class A beta-lactamase-related serine hydrolase [Labedella phragmitis]
MTIDRTSILRSLAPYLEQWLAFQGAYRRTPGLQAAIRVDDEVVLDTAWGSADLETGEELTTRHLFRIASHSKTMTATAILQLVEAGTVRLDDPIEQWVPELEGTGLAGVSVRELLGHQGGVIRDGVENNFWQRGGEFLDREALIAGARSDGVVFAPNENFKYSNIGFSLLGLVIEAATGRSYNEHVSESIATRLGLADSGPEYDPERADEYAAGHTGLTAGDDSRHRIEHVDTRAMAAATGWFSTARDLTTYGAAHWFGDVTLVSDASKRLLQREESRVEAHGRELGRYGLGFELRTIGDRDLVGHSGGYPGHITRTWIDPTDRLVVSVLTNAVDGPADALVTGLVQLIDLALDAARAIEEDDTAVDTDLSRFTGRFANMWGVTDIVDLGGRLASVGPRAPEPIGAYQFLEVVGDDELRTESVPGFGATGERVLIERSDDGAITAVTMGGMTMWPIDTYRRALASGRPVDTLARMSL